MTADNIQNQFNALAREILKKTQDACGGDLLIQEPRSYTATAMRSSMFNSLYSEDAFRRLENVLLKLGKAPVPETDAIKHAVRKYFGARWYGVTVLAVMVVFFFGGLLLCAAVSERVRMFLRNWCCCNRRSELTGVSELLDGPAEERRQARRTSSKLARLGKRMRIGLLVLSVTCLLMLFLALGFAVRATIDLHESRRVMNCNMWLELNGYFNGATALKPRGLLDAAEYEALNSVDFRQAATGQQLVASVTTNWLGSSELKKQLAELQTKTEGAATNPMYLNFTNGKADLVSRVSALHANLVKDLEFADKIISKYDTAITKLDDVLLDIKTVGDWNAGYSLQFALKNVYNSKADIFRDELQSAIGLAWRTMDELIEKYAGPSSRLLAKAHDAVVKTGATILQIDSSIEQLHHIWNSSSGLVKALVIFLVVLYACYGVCAILAAGLTIHLSSHLIRTHRAPARRASEATHRRRTWMTAMIFCALGLSCSALHTGISFMTAVVGSDGCQVVSTSLLDEGNWNLLGSKVLAPEGAAAAGAASVDMRAVLDVCVKRSGTGAIGITLGLDAPISEVYDDVTDAIEDISTTRERLLRRNSRYMRVHIIGFMMNELLRGFTHQAHYKTDSVLNSDRVPVFNGLQEINFENHTSITEGRRVMLAPVPAWPTLVPTVLKHGLFYTLGSIPDAYTMLNALSDAAYAANETTAMPRFCGGLAKSRRLACAYYETGADKREIIALGDPSINQEMIDKWLGRTAGDWMKEPSYVFEREVPMWGEYYNGMGSRMRQLIGAVNYIERAAQVPGSELGFSTDDMDGPICVDDPSAEKSEPRKCTFEDYRLFHISRLEENWTDLSKQYDGIIGAVDTYVDELVIPQSRDLVDSANDLIFKTNCQFQGSQLDYAVYAPLCWTLMPAVTELALLSFVSFCVLLLLAVLLWLYKPLFYDNYLHAESLLPTLHATPQPQRLSIPNAQPRSNSAFSSASTTHYNPKIFPPLFAPFEATSQP